MLENKPLLTYRSKYGFEEFVKADTGKSKLIKTSKLQNVRSAASRYGKANNMSFACQIDEGGIRVWRIK